MVSSNQKTVHIFLLIVLFLLPFHTVITRSLNLSLLTYWKEAIIILALYLACLGIFLREIRLDYLFNKTNFFVWIFIAVVGLSTLLHLSKTSLYGSAGYILYILFYFLLIIYVQKKQIGQILNMLLGLGLILASGVMVQFLVDPYLFGLSKSFWLSQGGIVRGGSFMGGAPSVLGTYLTLLVPVAMGLFLTERKKIYSAVYLIVALLMIFGVIGSFSRAAWFCLILSLLFLLFLMFFLGFGIRKCISQRLLIVLVAGFIIYVSLINFTSLKQEFSPDVLYKRFISSFDFQHDPSNVVRLQRWKATLSFISEETIFLGAGPGIGWLFGTYEIMPRSELLQKLARVTGGTPSTESFYLLVLVELGILGLIAFILFQLYFIWLGICTAFRFRSKNIKFAILISGVTAGLIGFFPFATLMNWPIVSLFWLYCAIITISSRK